ncbi:galactokinase [Nostocoides vanveenii]|uniref:Galactokinase n=1 Tax=Nostocoides vanveenii TaxID=330835 RepID=A0ABN2K5F2_9MICO
MDREAAFEEHFGTRPEGAWAAPGRVNLIGEHTDYNGGLALPIALPQRTYAMAARRADDRLRVMSMQTREVVEIDAAEIAPGRPAGWASYVAGVLWAVRAAGHRVGGLDLLIDGRVPLGAGLSSSAAIECATGAALSGLYGLGLLDTEAGRRQLATICRRAENEIALAPTGGMDQSASLLAQSEHALLLDCRDGSTRQVPFEIERDGLVLLVIDTRAHHALVDGQYGARRASCERAAAALGLPSLREVDPARLDAVLADLVGLLAGDGPEPPEVVVRRVRHVVTEIERVQECAAAMTARDWEGVGRLFAASHASLRDDFEVSCLELDLACSVAQDQGALGARMTGGGFGGSAIALVPEAVAGPVQAAVTEAFAAAGLTAPSIFAAHAAPGAG